MTTDFISAELVAYLNGELPPARRQEIEGLLRSDPDRAKELEDYKKAQKVLAGLRVSRASTGFHDKVRERITRKVEELRAKGSPRFRTARERVQAARKGLTAAEIRRRSKKAFKLYVIALLFTLPILGLGLLGAHYYFAEQRRMREQSEKEKQRRRQDSARTERRDARARALKPAAIGGRIRGLDFLEGRDVHLVPHQGRAENERCVFVYDKKQWEKYLGEIEKRRGLRGYETQLDAARRARVVPVRQGALLLPRELHQEHLGGPIAVEILRLRDRAEIWVPEDLEDYLAVKVMIRPRRPAPPGPGRMRLIQD
ncbi:MAG: anti-sigma factor family protein [Planctomycetota bacterium]|jgi:hypothetical protein